jgi:hypothetical protein
MVQGPARQLDFTIEAFAAKQIIADLVAGIYFAAVTRLEPLPPQMNYLSTKPIPQNQCIITVVIINSPDYLCQATIDTTR